LRREQPLKPLIPRGFDRPCHFFRQAAAATQQGPHASLQKISLANFPSRDNLSERAEIDPLYKESHNGLESTEDRRSAVRHGNQHVCERCPQVILGAQLRIFHDQVDNRTVPRASFTGNVNEPESAFAVFG
jgi:hypothetical protein